MLKSYTVVNKIDLSKVLKRLVLIKELILLEDFDDIQSHLQKLIDITNDDKIIKIASDLNLKLYSDAIIGIEIYLNEYQRLVVFEDPEIESLKIEIKKLEIEVGTISDEIAETEKLIYDFGIRHSTELGDVINKILKYRKDIAEFKKDESDKNKIEYEEARDDYESYNKQYIESKSDEQFELSEEDQKKIKTIYRSATKLCHPDVVADKLKLNAESVFNKLQVAYKKNDLKTVCEIFEMLEKGEMFISKSESITEKVKLKSELIRLRNKAAELRNNLNELLNSQAYQTIMLIDDWDTYFRDTKEKLSKELRNLEC